MANIHLLLQELSSIKNLELFHKQLPFLENSIMNIFLAIKKTPNIEDANVYFNLLEDIQTTLIKFFMQEKVNLPSHLKKFIKDFDRIDDADMRVYFFKSIKEGTYTFL